MKRLLLFLSIYSQLFILPLQSQDYKPFLADEIYVYDGWYTDYLGVDSLRGLYSLRIDSVFALGADSLFMFNEIAPDGWGRDNIFGRSMLKSPGGIYQFFTSDLDTFLIQTDSPLNTSWDFNKPKGIVATLTQKGERIFMGITDSVLSISLSNGDSILISQNYGCIEISPFIPIYTDGIHLTQATNLFAGHLSLWGIDGLIGKDYPWFEQIFDWEIGDRFIFEGQWNETTPDYSFQRVIDRYNSPNMDSILYTLEVENLNYTRTQNAYGYVGHGMLDTVEQHIIREEWYEKQMSYEVIDENGVDPGELSFRLFNGFQFSEIWDNKPCLYFTYYSIYDSSDTYYSNFESFASETYVPSFGKILNIWASFPYNHRWELICYQNGTDSIGNCFDPLVLPNDPLLPEGEMRVYPNPARNQVRVKISGIKPGDFELSIRDVQGRVFVQKQVSIHRDDDTLQTDLSALSDGLYFVVLRAENGQILRKALSIIR